MHLRGFSAWARETGILILSQGSVVAATWVLSILVARELGPSEFGIFTACLGAAIAAAVFVDAGLSRWLLREFSALYADGGTDDVRPSVSALLLSSLRLWVLFAGALIIAIACVALLAGFSRAVAIALVLLVAYTALSSLGTLLETVFRAQRRVGVVALATVAEKVVLAGGVAVVLTVGVRIELLAVAYVGAAVARLIFDHALLSRTGIDVRRAASGPVRPVLRASLPFFMNSVAFTAITRADPVLIAANSTTAAGYYGVGDRLLSVVLFVPITATTALFPHLSGAAATTRAGLHFSGIITVVSAGLAAPLVIAAPALVPALYGEGFDGSVELVQLMIGSLPAIAMSNGLTVTLFTRRRERLAVSLNLTIMALGSAALLVGTVLAGATGAGLAYLLRAYILAAALVVATLVTSSNSREAPPAPS